MDSFVLPSFISPNSEDIKRRIYARIRSDLHRIEAEIDRNINSSIPLISVVARHIMGSGGKRLRPLLMILSSRLCGYTGDRDVSLSVVFEFIHAASLLHDDVVDHAEFRRNQPAANTIWGNPGVVLVGDFLYSKSFLMTVGYNNIRILEVLSSATTKMAEGEVLQMVHSDNLEVDEEEYLEVITRKTAVLISAACQVGAIFGGASPEEEEALRAYGHHLGIAFQLVDDTLDYTGDVKELGKPVGNDIREGKATLPLIYTIKKAKPSVKKRLGEIFCAEEILPENFLEVREMVMRSGGIEYTLHSAIEHVQKAKESLDIFPAHPTKETLVEIADYVLCRRV
ncbi:polyprenyl synthetase family protein [Desulforhabdus amnigena]|uniref:Octaprenyl diphosphate synthase n=1 Tax=Desulforhabdus amnigena TaxID=40218 RepID=A0A9W6FW85_9BACT|nr:polyprenyl synthetase family protein [Desulforhabdus amnigena]GLI36051.1 octaprenyl diphosphate synthase [Desulforhabdus amnigena]